MKKILLVGGSSGIGLNLVEILLEKGDKITVLSRSNQHLNLNKVEHIAIDINNWDSPLPEIEGSIDGFVYFPGSINLKPFTSFSLKDFESDMKINYFSAIRVLQKYLPNLKKSPLSSIVFLTTVATKIGLSFHTSISGAKSALEGLSLSLAAELSPSIRVNTVAPSLTQTTLSEKLLDSNEKKEKSIKIHPLQKIGQTKDIASMIAFLLSDDGSWITGKSFCIDGGLSSIKYL
jgi:3-oxoacyl-[acyl-carrier protein] reductase